MRREGGGGGDEEEEGTMRGERRQGMGLREEGAGLGFGRIAACYIQWKCDLSHRFTDEWSKIVGPFRTETGLIHL
jgi:hypothetical protein